MTNPTITTTITTYGTKVWLNDNDKPHREDGPAVEFANGDKYWYRDGKFHREDGPAAEYANGSKCWYRNDKYHREDGPAVEYSDGTKYWYYRGKYIPCQDNKTFLKMLKLKAFL